MEGVGKGEHFVCNFNMITHKRFILIHVQADKA